MIGGGIDRTLLWLVNSMLAIPGLLFAMLFVAAMGPGLMPVMLSVGIGGIPGFARLTRTTTLQIQEETYIEAARALGASPLTIAFRHILPNAMRTLASFATTYFAWALLGTTTLTFLGLAGEPSLPEWGAMLNESRVYLVEAPWIAFWPALLLGLTMFSIHTLSEGISSSRSS
jgi:peptide/nickel transport system permease protein